MKELSTEEKAKRYDEIINKMKHYVVDEYGCSRIKVADVFPELKESEDEKIRKKLISLIEWSKSYSASSITTDESNEMISWLEKQGEQKPVEWSVEDVYEYNHILKILNSVVEEQETKGYNNLISSVNWLKSLKDRIQSKPSNKPQGKTALEAINEETVDNSNKIVNPKFKVGDWVAKKDGDKFCDGRRYVQITANDGEDIWFDSGSWLKSIKIRHWTIQDVEDGDIIYAKSKFSNFSYIRIFSKTENGNSWDYCNVFSEDLERWVFDNDEGFLRLNRFDFYPASKEQRDLLFQKMKEAGYEWDAKKKKLKQLKKK